MVRRTADGARQPNIEVEIHVAGNSVSSSILQMNHAHEDAAPESKYVGVQRVQVRRLDEFNHPALAAARCLLKIDTQGYEMAVLHGTERLLPRLRGVQLELSLTPLYDGQAMYLDLIRWLQERGFELWNVTSAFVDPGSGRLLQLDGCSFAPPTSSEPAWAGDGATAALRSEDGDHADPQRMPIGSSSVTVTK